MSHALTRAHEAAKAAAVSSNVSVGVSSDELQYQSPFLQAAIKAQQGFCDVGKTAQTMGLPRRTYLGIPRTTVAANASAAITLTSNQNFIGYSLRLPAATAAASFEVNNIKIMTTDQIVQGPIPGAVFSEVSQSAQVDLDMLKTPQNLVLSITNLTAGNAIFSGAFEGFTITGC